MDRLDELRATAHPLRLRLLSLMTGRAMSAAEAARELGETQANISYHVRQLEKAGLLELVETVRVRGGVGKRYRHVSAKLPEYVDPGENTDWPGQRLAAAIASEMLRRVEGHKSGNQVFSDAELWVAPADWDSAIATVTDAIRALHNAAKPDGEPGAIAVSVTAALFQTGPS